MYSFSLLISTPVYLKVIVAFMSLDTVLNILQVFCLFVFIVPPASYQEIYFSWFVLILFPRISFCEIFFLFLSMSSISFPIALQSLLNFIHNFQCCAHIAQYCYYNISFLFWCFISVINHGKSLYIWNQK